MSEMSQASTVLRSAVIALRPHQWVKNLLVFVPIFAAHQFSGPGPLTSHILIDTLLAFWAFNCCASSTYLINDLCDITADRQHPLKCRRPIASGQLPRNIAALMAVALAVSGVGISLLFPNRFYLYVVFYLFLTSVYSLRLKRAPLLDIISLASLYTLRVLGAGAALNIEISPWLLAFTMFLFFSLASVKRLAELQDARTRGLPAIPHRGYQDSDLEVVLSCGTVAGYIAALVLVLYASDPIVTRLYRAPHALWCSAPLLVYWISRLLLLANRGEIIGDPLVFALKDKTSYFVGAAGALLLVAASI